MGSRRGTTGRIDDGLPVVAVHDYDRRDDERVWHVQRLVLSYSRLPLAMARDGMLPKIFGKVSKGKRNSLGGHPGMRQLLGAMPGNRL